MLGNEFRRDTVENLPGDDFDSDDFDAVDFQGADGAARWAADPVVGFASASPPGNKTDADQEITTYTVTNPPGSVSVSALMDGRIEYVRLSKQVTQMSETHLASEILVIADLARQKAQSAQYTFILEKMSQGDDGDEQRAALLHEFVGNTWNLPTPEAAAAAEAEVFATRYGDDSTTRSNKGDHWGLA